MQFTLLTVLVLPALATLTFRRTGWLDRVVEYTKDKFVEDLIKTDTFRVEVQKPPVGYKDSEDWDFDSVQRLLRLIFATESAKPVQELLEEALVPTRRYGISHGKSLIKIPSLAASHPGFFYDYVESNIEPSLVEEPNPWRSLRDNEVLYISNPVEAHMPSAHISVGHIREILTQRSKRARRLPTKQSSVFTWTSPSSPIILNVVTNKVETVTTSAAAATPSKPVLNGQTTVNGDQTVKSDQKPEKGDQATENGDQATVNGDQTTVKDDETVENNTLADTGNETTQSPE